MLKPIDLRGIPTNSSVQIHMLISSFVIVNILIQEIYIYF